MEIKSMPYDTLLKYLKTFTSSVHLDEVKNFVKHRKY